MISKAQRILFLGMLLSVVIMAAILIRLRERAQDRLHSVQSSVPLIAPTESEAATVTLIIPNDADGSLTETEHSMSLPEDNTTRAMVLLQALLSSFHDPHSTHPIAAANTEGGTPGPDVDQVFLMPVPERPGSSSQGTLAVVDLSAAFAASHPSGIEPETLTLLAILGTLHDNIPSITQVRFLIDGHPAETLAGHADLTRVYLATSIGARS